jgi:hypothetical protein
VDRKLGGARMIEIGKKVTGAKKTNKVEIKKMALWGRTSEVSHLLN